MTEMMSACGVMCSGCPAYLGDVRGIEHQKRTVAAWRKIYGMNETVEHIACGGCLAADKKVFHTSRTCKARNCCRSKGFTSCAVCDVESCPDLEKAQSVWDGVPAYEKTLSPADFAAYARPYCGHRERLAAARKARQALTPSSLSTAKENLRGLAVQSHFAREAFLSAGVPQSGMPGVAYQDLKNSAMDPG